MRLRASARRAARRTRAAARQRSRKASSAARDHGGGAGSIRCCCCRCCCCCCCCCRLSPSTASLCSGPAWRGRGVTSAHHVPRLQSLHAWRSTLHIAEIRSDLAAVHPPTSRRRPSLRASRSTTRRCSSCGDRRHGSASRGPTQASPRRSSTSCQSCATRAAAPLPASQLRRARTRGGGARPCWAATGGAARVSLAQHGHRCALCGSAEWHGDRR
jgi:hypothetical protein